jgi:tyrosyl-tRNA synthetase
MNLLTKSDGTKFGKTESGAVWLDAEETSPYEFYQFFLNQEDGKTFKLQQFVTFSTEQEINDLEKRHQETPSARIRQTKLAKEITHFVHGNKGFEQAETISTALVKGSLHELKEDNLNIIISK